MHSLALSDSAGDKPVGLPPCAAFPKTAGLQFLLFEQNTLYSSQQSGFYFT